MDSAAAQGTGGVASDARLADLSNVSLPEILTERDDDSPLSAAIRHVIAQVKNETSVISAFGSFTS
ncbi:MAG TPA: hypothetical protein VF657_16220 [Actinoplanes sp.]|jgi:hypothetical protein